MTARGILWRLAMAAVTLFGVAVVVFLLLRVAPGDPIAMMIAPGAGAEDIARLRAVYGLDRPIPVQFGIWLLGILKGDFGTSISLRTGVAGVLGERLPATLELAVAAFLIALAIGASAAVAGTLMARRAGEAVLDSLNGLVLAVPDFIWALAFVVVFGVLYPVFPLSGRMDPTLDADVSTRFLLAESLLTGQWTLARDVAAHMAMPAMALALPLAAVIARVLKASLVEAMLQDYVILARIRGRSPLGLVLGEALRNAVGPALALTGVQFTFLVGGTVIVERIFAYPGLGNLAIDAVINRDLPLIQGLVLMFGLLFIGVNIAVDLAATALNPRLRHG